MPPLSPASWEFPPWSAPNERLQRYPAYEEGFALECRALARVRSAMGLTNVKVMVPFCRRLDEAERVIGYGAPWAGARARWAGGLRHVRDPEQCPAGGRV